MGLLPLEFSDCLLDSPYYRENLKAHERQLEQTSVSIKSLITGITGVLESAKMLIKAKKTLAESLENCQFDCLGTTLTDDEILIASSLKQFAKFLSAMEDEMNGILLQANDKFITPLMNFRKDHIGSVKSTKKAFDKATSKLCTAQDKYVGMSGKKEESLAEAADIVRHEQKNLNSSSLEYVYLMHMVQERKKFEFVEAILNFTQSWVNYYRKGADFAKEQEDYMSDLKDRVQKTRDNFSATSEKYEDLKVKMASSSQDPGVINRMYTRQGYLFVQGRKNLKLGSVWTKYFCQYQAKTKTLTMIPYSQLTGKITCAESLRVTGCTCYDDTCDKFRFSVTGEDLTEARMGMMTYNIQALSEFERKHWVEALGGTWPAVNTLQRIKADSVEDNLNSCAFTFLKDCLSELESRGLVDQGLYRVGGVVSKVKKLLNQALDPAPGEECPDMSDPKQWESKTLASAVKQYFRDLSKPLMTYQLYCSFLEAVKKEDESTRLNEIYLVLQKLPRANREILKVLIRHLNKVSLKSDKNLMTASNLGVVFGPSLLRPREETVASIMDIKFCNEVISILIENCERFFSSAESSPEFMHNRRPSIESRSTEATSSNSTVAASTEAPSSVKCKRTQSFSSFSQLSSASLPDIKEYHHKVPKEDDMVDGVRTPVMTRLISDRPRSRSHQHDILPHFPAPSLSGASSSSKEGSPAPLHLSKAATQDDLMASLEMMNSLASDLPSSSSPFKRSYTLNPKRMTRTPGREITRKPPLPKLPVVSSPVSPVSTPIYEGAVPTMCNTSHNNIPGTNLNHPPTTTPPPPFQRQNSAPTYSEHLKINSNNTKPSRPSDLPAKLISAFEGLCSSPGQSRRAYQDNNLVIEEYGACKDTLPPVPPSPPVRKTQNMYVSSTQHTPDTRYTNYISLTLGNNDGDQGDNGSMSSVSSRSSPVPVSHVPPIHVSHNNVSVDSGVLISPSPPTDSGIALMSPMVKHKHFNNNNNSKNIKTNPYEDSVSVLSCSLSEVSDASGSKYDNVAGEVTDKVTDPTDSSDILDDDTDSDDNKLDNSQTIKTCDFDEIPCDIDMDFPKKTGPKSTSDGRLIKSQYRASGPYENVSETTDIDNNGVQHLRRILTNGQTSNV